MQMRPVKLCENTECPMRFHCYRNEDSGHIFPRGYAHTHYYEPRSDGRYCDHFMAIPSEATDDHTQN